MLWGGREFTVAYFSRNLEDGFLGFCGFMGLNSIVIDGFYVRI